MKKITLLTLALLPSVVFAQTPVVSNADFIWNLFVFLFVLFVVFIICRELMCWYWKINKMVSNQEEIIRLLRKIANESNTPINESKAGEEKRNILKELGDSAKFMVTGK